MEPNTIFANRYKLQKRIGMGGFSEVWSAIDQMADDAEIAIKIYAPERGMDEQGLKQFRREYAVVLNLNHSNLLTARYFDIWEGRPFLVMPLIDGGSLYDKLEREGEFNEKQSAELIRQVADGLAHLHSHEILHQDIKPDNILIGKGDTYLLMDFGISMRMRSTLRKQTGMVKAMTVAYAPPERFAAKPQQVAAGDIFSLGVLVYEMITGDVPWMGNGGVSLQTGAAVPELPETFSEPFRRLVASMMAVRPEDRPTPESLVEATSQFMRTGSWPAAGGAPGSGAGRTARGRETQIIDTAGLGAVAGGAGAGIGAAAAGAQYGGEEQDPRTSASGGAVDRGAGDGSASAPGSGGAGGRETRPMSAEAAAAALGDSGSGSGAAGGGAGAAAGSSAGDPGGKKTMVGKASDAAAADAGGAATAAGGGGGGGLQTPRPAPKSGGAGKWIIAAIVLFVLAGGGYFGFTRYMNNVAEQEARILSLLEQADGHLESGDLDAAMITFQMVIDRDSQNQDALDGIAEVQRQRQESEADREARIASLLEQGASQASAGDLDAALITYQSVLDRDSTNETALTEISTVRQRIRDRDAQRAEQDRIRREQEAARRTITGTITDSRSGSALAGVNVSVEGGSASAATNAQGGYTITAPNQNATLRITNEGYVSQTIGLEGRTRVDVALEPTAPDVIEPDLNASPVNGTVDLTAGFTPDPWTRTYSISNNNVDLSNFDGFGFVSVPPTFNLNYTSGTFPLYIGAESSTDLVMLINKPDGSWAYNDDFDGSNPRIEMESPQSGVYNIWIGTYSQTTASANVYITELSADDSNGGGSGTLGDGSGPDPSREPQYGSVNLRAGFTPDPHTQSILAGGSNDLSGYGHVGYVATAPDYVVNYTAGTGSLPLIIKVGEAEEDTVILIQTPDGRWEFNDDFEGVRAGIRFDNPRSGAYKIWVGSYGSDFVQTTLHITEYSSQ